MSSGGSGKTFYLFFLGLSDGDGGGLRWDGEEGGNMLRYDDTKNTRRLHQMTSIIWFIWS